MFFVSQALIAQLTVMTKDKDDLENEFHNLSKMYNVALSKIKVCNIKGMFHPQII